MGFSERMWTWGMGQMMPGSSMSYSDQYDINTCRW